MDLPVDFQQQLAKAQNNGLFEDNLDVLEGRLLGAIQVEAPNLGAAGNNLGLLDWSSAAWKRIQSAVHREICNPPEGLKEKYNTTFEEALTPTGVTKVAGVVMAILAAVNVHLVVSSILVLFAIWIIKVGANDWCTVELA